jgi:hypothetical protein
MPLKYQMLRVIEYNRDYGFIKHAVITIEGYKFKISIDFKHKPLCVFGYYGSGVSLYRILHGPIFVVYGYHTYYKQLPYSILMSEVI